jgi:hypothetical protein
MSPCRGHPHRNLRTRRESHEHRRLRLGSDSTSQVPCLALHGTNQPRGDAILNRARASIRPRAVQNTTKRLRAQPSAATITELQHQLDPFVEHYNHHRPHRSLPHHTTPAAAYTNGDSSEMHHPSVQRSPPRQVGMRNGDSWNATG